MTSRKSRFQIVSRSGLIRLAILFVVLLTLGIWGYFWVALGVV